MSLRTWWRDRHRRRAERLRPDPIWTPPWDPRFQVPQPHRNWTPPGPPIYRDGQGRVTTDPKAGPLIGHKVWDRMPVRTEPFRIKEN